MISTAASPEFPCLNCEVRDQAVCSVLSDEELVNLNRISTSVDLDRGQMAFLESDENSYLFNVVSGSLRLTKLLADGRRQIVGFLFPGDFLGLSVKEHYTCSAEALEQTSLCRFSRKGLADILQRFPQLEHRLLKLASNEIAQAQDHLLILGQKLANERLASALIKLSERIGKETPDGWLIDLPMSRRDIADYIGLTIETVSRTITQMEREGLLSKPSTHSLLLPNLERFSELTGDM